jgi:hypothetical protein
MLLLNDLLAYVLRCCQRRVRTVIDSGRSTTGPPRKHTSSIYMTQTNGNRRTHLNDTDNGLRFHTDRYLFSRFRDVDRYYREFTAQSTPLTAVSRVTTNKANLLFYKGILSSMHKKGRRKIPDAHQTASSAPSIA